MSVRYYWDNIGRVGDDMGPPLEEDSEEEEERVYDFRSGVVSYYNRNAYSVKSLKEALSWARNVFNNQILNREWWNVGYRYAYVGYLRLYNKMRNMIEGSGYRWSDSKYRPGKIVRRKRELPDSHYWDWASKMYLNFMRYIKREIRKAEQREAIEDYEFAEILSDIPRLINKKRNTIIID